MESFRRKVGVSNPSTDLPASRIEGFRETWQETGPDAAQIFQRYSHSGKLKLLSSYIIDNLWVAQIRGSRFFFFRSKCSAVKCWIKMEILVFVGLLYFNELFFRRAHFGV